MNVALKAKSRPIRGCVVPEYWVERNGRRQNILQKKNHDFRKRNPLAGVKDFENPFSTEGSI